MKQILCWLKYRKCRKEQSMRAASLAVKLVLTGSLVPPRLAGAKGRIEEVFLTAQPLYRVLIRREGQA